MLNRWVVSAGGLGLVLVAGCAVPPASSEGGTVVAALTTDPKSMSLLGTTDRNTDIVARLVTDSLVRYDRQLELQPRLARSWTLSEDGTTLVFELRPDVRWHDGQPVTADDVVFSVDKARDPATQAASYLSQFQDLVSVEAVDPLTVRATYSKPYADVLEAWEMPVIPRHLAARDADLLTGAFAEHPVGCGPFRFVSYVAGREIVLEANPDYWDGPPAAERLVLRIIPNERTAYQALLRGELSWMTATPELWDQAHRSGEIDRLGSLVFYRTTVWHVGWNQTGSNPFFVDPRVRRAMVLALDRERFIEHVLQGLGRAAITTYHPDGPWADPALRPRPYDPVEAARLLDEAGWSDTDGDGVRERNGRAFDFTLTYSSAQAIAATTATWMQEALREIGVRMRIERLEWRAFLERRRAGQFEASMSALGFTPVPDQFEVFHSTARQQGLNYFGLADDEVDRLLERGRVTFDVAERRRIYQRLQRRLFELEPIACLFHLATPVLHDPRFAGLEPSPLDIWRVTPGPRAWRVVGEREGD